MPPRADPERQWPPRSPHEALLSTPGGRERLRRLAERASPSPSPSKRASRPTSSRGLHDGGDAGLDPDVDDEDEELLELELAAIQAKLRLKKLQAARTRQARNIHAEPEPEQDAAPLSRAQSRADGPKAGLPTSQSHHDIQVPASPVRRAQPAPEVTSPSRVRLGIDKGLRAKDVSLKRAPSLKKAQDVDNGTRGGYLRRANTPAPDTGREQRPMSFNERIAVARADEKTRREQQQRIQQVRTKAFKLGEQELEELKQKAKELPDLPSREESYGRDEIMAGDSLKRSHTMPSLHREARDLAGHLSDQGTAGSISHHVSPSEIPEEEASAFEPYSCTHLRKRIIPHLTLARNISGKKTYLIPDLLKDVKAPDFQLPDIEQDVVIFGILASKSEPRAHKDTGSNVKEKLQADPTKSKYMVLTIVDLTWEIELFLFNTGFERYWKLTPGTLLAILNPTIMPPPPNRTDTGKFSLVINSGHDTILEVGAARDLGFCKSIKKDGTLCSSWVNSKRTEYCEFHMNLALSKKMLARQDVNAFNTGLGPKNNSRRLHKWEEHANDPGKKKRGNYDWETRSTFFVQKPSAASMIDNEILGDNGTSTIERSQALRRRFATEEKERSLMKTLGEAGSGAGKEYMKIGQRSTKDRSASRLDSSFTSTAASQASSMDDAIPQRDAKSLGLIQDKKTKIHLSPLKRRRVESAMSSRSSSLAGFTATSSSTVGAAGLGWGGGLKDKLARMKEGEGLRGAAGMPSDSSAKDTPSEDNKDSNPRPARKKTRFITEKGIREAGRESLGAELSSKSGQRGKGGDVVFLDDDDELVILE
ncbi:hypothetical protein F4777DRAFT_554173 [Nemania sp. FL0916]|nr:hypothetical protein F4777DRAFT_554173 [Nemania sp. FL0916]